MKKLNELTAGEIKYIIWGDSTETFTRMMSLALLVGVMFFVFGSSWLFSIFLILGCLVNWFWRMYTLEVKNK